MLCHVVVESEMTRDYRNEWPAYESLSIALRALYMIFGLLLTSVVF